MTLVCLLICLQPSPVSGIMISIGHGAAIGAKGLPAWAAGVMIAVPLLTILISAAFTVRGYRVGNGMFAHFLRLGWETRYELSRLTSAKVDPDALKGSIRIFGNGGFFCFAGVFRNSKLGVYRAYATDAPRAVVLCFWRKNNRGHAG